MLEKNYRINNGVLSIGEVSVEELKEKYNTPLYIYDQKLFKETAQIFLKNFKSNKFKSEIVYASKAFSNLYIIGLVKSLGLDLDVVSSGELYTALKAGFSPEKIHFHGNNKLVEELDMAIKNDVGSIIIDNISEYKRISEISKKYKKKSSVLLRVNPEVHADTHKFIQTSNADSKFGMHVLRSDTNELIKMLIEDDNIEFEGIHAHIGSQVTNGEFFYEEADILMDYMKKIQNEFSYEFTKINFGGGFGVEQKKGDKYLDLSNFLRDFSSYIEEKIEKLNLSIDSVGIEPGRSMINQSGNMLYTVGTVKETLEGYPFLFIDGGMSDNIRPSLYDAEYDVYIANKMDKDLEKNYRVGGKLCESGDILVKETKAPEVSEGDLLLIPSSGAYTFSMHSRYNKLPRPAVVFVENGKDYLAVKRESLDDLLINEIEYKGE